MTPNEMREKLDAFSGSMEVLCDYNVKLAELLKQKYDALVEAGFTEVQAMDIIKAHGIGIGGD